MHRRLRLRFFLISWGLLILLLTAICTGIGIYWYQSAVSGTEHALRTAVETETLSDDSRGMAALQLGAHGDLAAAEQNHLSLSEDTLESLARQIEITGEQSGGTAEVNGVRYRYLGVRKRGGAWVAVSECTQETSVQETIRKRLPVLGALGALLLLPVCLLLSHWASKPIEQAWEKQNDFVSDATHELKTPLAVIAADTDAVLANPEATIESQGEWLGSIQSQTTRMAGLVGDLLFLAKIDAGEIHLEAEDLAISDLLEGVCMEREAELFERGRTLDYEMTPGLHYRGDRNRIEQMVAALLNNAAQYTPEGGSIRVVVNRDRKQHLRIVISNTGTPISQEDLTKIFDRFYRADPSRARETGGYGLGLCVARSIAELHGGTIEATSGNGVNVFTVLLGNLPEAGSAAAE